MEETVSWKGHSFTLLVFAGIVILCSIFFVLGMLVGRGQGQRAAGSGLTETHAKAAPAYEEKSDKKPDFVIERAATPPPARPSATQQETVKGPPPAANVIHFQVGGFKRSNAAEKLLGEVRTRGFPAFILAPPSDDPNPLYKVQVGPYD